MKSNYKKVKISISLIIVLLISSAGQLIKTSLIVSQNIDPESQNTQINEISLKEHPKVSGMWNVDFIYIKNDNWSETVLPWIKVNAGTEQEPHIIENVTLNGNGRENGIIIENCREHFEIRNSRVFNCGIEETTYSEAGILLFNTSNGRIINNNCSANLVDGIVLYGPCENNTIYNNTLEKNNGLGISLLGFVELIKFTNITGNNINQNGGGISCMYATNTTIFNNSISSNLGTGIQLEWECSYMNISKNVINGNGYGPDPESKWGIFIFNAIHCNILNNTINYNKGDGISVTQSLRSSFENNIIQNNGEYGIYFSGKKSNITNNRLINCGIGIGFTFDYIETNVIDKTNTVNDKYFYYYYNEPGLNYENFTDAGQIVLFQCNNSVISSLTITNSTDAIRLVESNSTTIKQNNLNDNTKNAIEVIDSFNNTIEQNDMSNNKIGINLGGSNNITLKNNNMTNCGLDIGFPIFESPIFNIDTTNKVNKKPVYYFTNTTDINLDFYSNAGQVLLYNCNNSKIRDLDVSYGSIGLILSYCNNITISNITSNFNKINGLKVGFCKYLNITECFFDHNEEDGIVGELSGFSFSIMKNNSINYNKFDGLSFESLSSNNFTDNIISFNGGDGIKIYAASYNDLIGNTIKNNTKAGISLRESINNDIIDNTIKNNLEIGILIIQGGPSVVFQNNIIKNSIEENKEAGIKLTGFPLFPLINNNTILNNTIINNENGIIFSHCNDSIIEGNLIVNNLINGIKLINSNYTEIKSNAIINCTNIGIYITSNGSIYNYIYNNTFFSNQIHAIENSLNNFWNNSLIGNYWDNYTGSDGNGDGIGEDPFYVDGEGEGIDRMPIWDSLIPNTKIILPLNESVYSEAPNFTVSISDEVSNTVWYHHLVGPIIKIDKMWYVLNYSTPKLFFTNNNGTIDLNEWKNFSNGTIIITFYANDTCGNVNSTSITIYKECLEEEPTPFITISGDDDDDKDDKSDRSDRNEFILIIFIIIIISSVSAIAATSLYYYQKRNKTAKSIPKIRAKESNEMMRSSPSSKEILMELTNKNLLIQIFETKEVKKLIDQLDNIDLTAVSNEFLRKLDSLSVNIEEKREFLKEMLLFSPYERNEILDNILKRLNSYHEGE